MKAIVLAAGTGSRLSAAASGPKCLVELRGRPLLAHQLAVLDAVGIEDVVAITGYRATAIADAFPHLATRECRRYASSNNLWTLADQRDLLRGEVVILFADVLVTAVALRALLASPGQAVLLVDRASRRRGTMRVRLDGDRVVDVGGHIEPRAADGNFVGIARLEAPSASLLARALSTMGYDERCRHDYYTLALVRLAAEGMALRAADLDGERWLEVDTPADLEVARAADFYLI